jgi:hypothetical protein
MTCLTLVQTAYKRLGLPNLPTAVVTSTDPQVAQFLALANEEGQTMAEATNWQALVKTASFTTVNTEIQGLMSTIAPGCKFIVNDTIWNLSLRFPVFGPLSAQRWAQNKAMFYQGPWNQYRVFDDQIHFVPTPPAGQSCTFEYTTKYWTTAGTSEEFVSDTDSSLLDEKVMVLGLIWRFRQAKGLDFQSDLTKYTRLLADYVARETPKPVLDLDSAMFNSSGSFDMGSGVIGSSTGFLPYL